MKKLYQMIEGISILNELTGQIGIALEYSHSSYLRYRARMEEDVVLVKINENESEWWKLENCIPVKERK
jgi:hypothetical protein